MIVKVEPSGTQVGNDTNGFPKGYLVIRLDFFAEATDKCYAQRHVLVPDFTGQTYPNQSALDSAKSAVGSWLDGLPKDSSGKNILPTGWQNLLVVTNYNTQVASYKAWVDSLPKVYDTGPFLSHHIRITTTTTAAQLQTIIKSLIDSATKASIDSIFNSNALQVNPAVVVAADNLMSPKQNASAVPISGSPNIPNLISTVNNRFKNIQVTV